MAYGNFKDLCRRTAASKILHDEDMMDINVDLLQWFKVILINRPLIQTGNRN